MPNFCPSCGAKLASPDVKFCSECGERIAAEQPKVAPEPPKVGEQKEIQKPIEPITPEKKPVSDTSRLVGLKIEKYLMQNEIVSYATRGSLYVGGEAGLKGYVTDHRVMFYASKGTIFKSDRFFEIALGSLGSYKIIEEGIILKTMHLKLNDLKITGDRSDILGLYKAIQAVKYQK